MEQTEKSKSNSAEPSKAPISAYFWLAGIFAIVFAVIYIALILRVHFLDIPSGESVISETASNSLFALVLVVMLSALYTYTVVSRKELLLSLREAGAIMTVFALVTTTNIFLAHVSPFAMFVALTSLLALPFSKKRDAFILNVFTCLISSFSLINIAESTHLPIIIFTSIAGLLCGAIAAYSFPNGMTRIASIFRSLVTSVFVIGMYAVLLCAYSLDAAQLVDNIVFIGPFAAGHVLLAGILVPIIESIFNITTDSKLVELTNHKAPLIHRLITEAPGTFNHSLSLANFAEICANAIGEDPYLARACAYYHDVGKLNNAEYFTENQAGYNPHDDILPEVSAEIIRQHTTDGYELCKKYHIPEEVARITIEHHGTLPIAYFYNKAQKLTDSDVDMDEYRYHGETPTGKIGAIIMICDAAEAAIRAMDNPDGERVDKFLKKMIDDRLRLGQFDNCSITMKDLNALREAIVGAYGGLFHKRIKYNNGRGGDND
ncbi:MAG: HDIG domain-containing protein [Clostridiales bacterium]|nr:HDIG domain-containing protein [Clostridiales bacterium]